MRVRSKLSDPAGLRSPGRRRFMLAGAAGAIAIGGAGVFSWNSFSGSRAAWVEQVVRRNLPGVHLDERSLANFIRDALAGDLLRPRARKVAVFAHQTAPWLTVRVPQVRDGLEKTERQVLTAYLLGSNFFRVNDPREETITYYGPAVACANPFVWNREAPARPREALIYRAPDLAGLQLPEV
jgi:hypothetical protein